MSTTTVDPWPTPMLGANNSTNNPLQMDWDTYINLNAYRITSIVAGYCPWFA